MDKRDRPRGIHRSPDLGSLEVSVVGKLLKREPERVHFLVTPPAVRLPCGRYEPLPELLVFVFRNLRLNANRHIRDCPAE